MPCTSTEQNKINHIQVSRIQGLENNTEVRNKEKEGKTGRRQEKPSKEGTTNENINKQPQAGTGLGSFPGWMADMLAMVGV